MDVSGTFNSYATLDNTPLTDVGFTQHVLFDITPNTSDPTLYSFAVTSASITIGGLDYSVITPLVANVSTPALSTAVFFMGIADLSDTGAFYNAFLPFPAGFDPANPTALILPTTPTSFPGPPGWAATIRSDLVLALDRNSTSHTLLFETTDTGISAITSAALTDTSAVPEPSTYALLCISLGVVGYARKRMNKAKSE
jgi:hypothetical protein